jgi:hypothetical protein
LIIMVVGADIPPIASARPPGFLEQGVSEHSAGDEACSLGLVGVHHAAGQAQFHRLGLADGG